MLLCNSDTSTVTSNSLSLVFIRIVLHSQLGRRLLCVYRFEARGQSFCFTSSGKTWFGWSHDKERAASLAVAYLCSSLHQPWLSTRYSIIYFLFIYCWQCGHIPGNCYNSCSDGSDFLGFEKNETPKKSDFLDPSCLDTNVSNVIIWFLTKL